MRTIDFIIIILIVLALGLLTYMVIQAKNATYNCIQNPIPFGIKQLEKQNNYKVICTCRSDNPNTKTLLINSTSITQQ
jgi:hypothetical protein